MVTESQLGEVQMEPPNEGHPTQSCFFYYCKHIFPHKWYNAGPQMRPALSLHIVNFPSRRAPILCIFALVNIKLFLYINDQFGNANKIFVCLLIWKHKFCRGIQMAIFFAISVFARIKKMGSDNENSHTRLSLVL